MSWIYEKFIKESEFSGQIKSRRLFGIWQIMAGGCYQTSRYTLRMWRKALKRLNEKAKIKNILILGLGAGGNIKQLYKKYANCQITAIELDPIMVEISHKTFLAKIKKQPRIVIGDALEIIKKFKQQFDLIIVDLYIGKTPSSSLNQSLFLINLQRLLKPEGHLLFNAYSQPQLFKEFDKCFSNWGIFRFAYNKLAVYRHFGQGQVGDFLPDNYQPYRASKEFLSRDANDKIKELVGQDNCYGLRWHHGPFYVESYLSDQEPEIKHYKKSRLVIWQPITKRDCSKPWRRSWVQMNSRQTGFSQIIDKDKYWQTWNSNAQRQRKKFIQNNDLEIVEVNVPEFNQYFLKINKAAFWGIKKSFASILAKDNLKHSGLVHCYLARQKSEQKVLGGLAVIDIPEIKQSKHFISFLFKGSERQAVGVGLIDRWFQDSIVKDLKFLDFGLFWTRGNPRSWRGFSRFKGQFGIRYVKYPYPLIRWIGKELDIGN